jgi:hypothetical protein
MLSPGVERERSISAGKRHAVGAEDAEDAAVLRPS